jgi:hypothetical protein
MPWKRKSIIETGGTNGEEGNAAMRITKKDPETCNA